MMLKSVYLRILILPVLFLFACGGGGGGATGGDGGTFSVGGLVSDLTGTLVLQNNGGDDLSRSANGEFSFSTPLADGASYRVTVYSQPTGQTCSVPNGSGTISGADVTNVAVTCSANMISDIWSTKTSMPTARAGLTTAFVNGKIYAIGGDDDIGKLATVEEYDPASDEWTNCGGTCAPMTTARYYLSSSVVNGKIYVFGGDDGTNSLTTVEEYDPASDEWTNCGGGCTAMPTARAEHTTSVVNGKIYIMGGSSFGGVTIVEEYDPSTNKWTNCGDSCESMPTPRSEFTSSVVNGKIYAIGGVFFSLLNVVEEFDPVTNAWTNCGGTCASMKISRYQLSSGVINGKIYALGGWDGLNALGYADVEEFDPLTNTWTTKRSMRTARGYLGSSEVNGKIYAIGGLTSSAITAAVEVYQ